MSDVLKCFGCGEFFGLDVLMVADNHLYCNDCNPLSRKPEKLESQPVAGKKVFGHPRFYKILEQMKELHSRKNHDYAGTSDPLKNLRACERLELKPFMGVMVRLQDKWSRLEEFVKSGKLMVKGESVIDTLMDNAVYSVLAIILYEEQQKQEAETTPGYGGNVNA